MAHPHRAAGPGSLEPGTREGREAADLGIQLGGHVLTELVAEGRCVLCLADGGVKELEDDFPIHHIIEELSQVVYGLIAALAGDKELELLRHGLLVPCRHGARHVAEYLYNLVPHFLAVFHVVFLHLSDGLGAIDAWRARKVDPALEFGAIGLLRLLGLPEDRIQVTLEMK